MSLRVRICLLGLTLCVLVVDRRGLGQGPCGIAPVVAADAQPNIFSSQQEEWLGEAMADLVEHDYTPVRDPSENAYLQSIADRLAVNLPAQGFKYRAVLIDSSEINGFSLAGGHIYLTRKLVSTAHSEDEIAAVIGHEMGHIASHQFVFETTRDLKRLLGVTSVGDRADVYAKFQQLMDAQWRDKHPVDSDSDDKEDQADKIGVYVAAAAGYRPQALAEFWDRSFFVGGKTGDRFSDFLGITKPDQRRLRGMQRMAAALPPGCGGTRTEGSAQFAAWHRAVVADQDAATEEKSRSGREVSLSPPLRMDLDRVRFSRDGKTILAQDEGSIFVLTRDPLAVKFRIDAEDALPAEFSPDSQKVVFSTPGLHTEEWSVAEGKLLAAHEVVARHPCFWSKLSPDGRTLVCIDFNFSSDEMDLDLLDVATSDVLWERKPFFHPDFLFRLTVLLGRDEVFGADLMPSSFSPDGNYLLIGPEDAKLAIDLRTRAPVKLGGQLRTSVTGAYAFLGNDQVAGVNARDPKDSGTFSFPDGRQLQKFPLTLKNMEAVSSAGPGLVVASRGLHGSGIALANLTDRTFVGLKTYAVDDWNGVMASENGDGTVGLSRIGSTGTEPLDHVMLPLSPLGRPATVEISADGKFLALSTWSRGGIWDLTTGQRIFFVRGFSNAIWTEKDILYADFPKTEKIERHMAAFSTATAEVSDLPYTLDDQTHLRYGRLMEWKAGAKQAVRLVMRHPEDGSAAWSKDFPDGQPTYTASYGDRDLIFNYPLQNGFAKGRLRVEGHLTAEAGSLAHKNLGRLIEVVDSATGKTVAEMVLELPLNFEGTGGLNSAGDLLYVEGRDNRTMVYSLETGKQVREIFGAVAALDPGTGRICTVNRSDEAVVYGANGEELAHFHMGRPLRYARFREGGSSLILLTADQKVSMMEIGGGSSAKSMTAKK